MKKFKVVFSLAVVGIALGACSSGGDSDNASSSSSSTEVSSTIESTTATETANQSVVDQLKADFGNDVNVEVEKDVIDSESDQPHEVITVSSTDEETAKGIEDAQSAINSNSADDTQKMTIAGIQTVVSEAAKGLAGDNDSVEFVYTDSVNNTMVVAYSTKSKDIIPIVE